MGESVRDYTMFSPQSKASLKKDYPELTKVEEFSILSNHELLFVWYYSHEGSPFFELDNDKERLRLSYENSFIVHRKGDETTTKLYSNMQFPPNVKAAIVKMQKYRITPRVEAFKMFEKAFQNMKHILNIDASQKSNFANKDGEIDMSKYKSYVDTVGKALEIMPDLIDKVENKFSVQERKGSSNHASVIDAWHNQKH